MTLKRIATSIAVVLALTGAATAQAAIITNTFNPADVIVSSTSPYSFMQDISADLAALGGPYSIDSATLNIYLNDAQGGNETLKFLIGANGAVQSFTMAGNNNVPNGNQDVAYPVVLGAALPDLQQDGKLNVQLSVTNQGGNYTFAKSVLEANVHVVPEPATVALLGLGLLGLTLRRRKQ